MSRRAFTDPVTSGELGSDGDLSRRRRAKSTSGPWSKPRSSTITTTTSTMASACQARVQRSQTIPERSSPSPGIEGSLDGLDVNVRRPRRRDPSPPPPLPPSWSSPSSSNARHESSTASVAVSSNGPPTSPGPSRLASTPRPSPTMSSVDVGTTLTGHRLSSPRFDLNHPDMPQVNIAILGAPGVGKSIFVRRALGLREPPVGVGSSRKMLIGGVIYLVRLLEFQWHHLQLDDGDNDDPDVPPIRWPTRIDDLQVPPIHGALLVCDRTGASNTAAVIPRILAAMVVTDLPFAYVATESDTPAEARQVQIGLCRRAGLGSDEIDCRQLSTNGVENEKRCVGDIVRKVRVRMMDSRAVPRPAPPPSAGPDLDHLPDLRRSAGTGPTSGSTDVVASTTSNAIAANPRSSHHLRDDEATSPTTTTTLLESIPSALVVAATSPPLSPHQPLPPPPPWFTNISTNTDANTNANASGRGVGPSHGSLVPPPPSSFPDAAMMGQRAPALTGPAASLVVVTDPPFWTTSSTSRPTTADAMTALFTEPDFGTDPHDPTVPTTSPVIDPDSSPRRWGPDEEDRSSRSVRNQGETLTDLVDRLLAVPVSKSDANFPVIFLCLYRIFAAPAQVLEIVLARIRHAVEAVEAVEAAAGADDAASPVPTLDDPSRMLGMLSRWVVTYPGDFAHPWARRRLNDLLLSLPTIRSYAAVVKDVRLALDVALDHDDVDAVWAKSDAVWLQGSAWTAPPSPADADPVVTVDDLRSSVHETTTMSTMPTTEPGEGTSSSSTRLSAVPSQSSSSQGHSTTLSGASSQTLLNTVDVAEREARRLVPLPRMSMSKTLWRQFVDCRDDDFAEELTRIDWIMFSAIRPRDIVRHISLSAEQREKSGSVENVNRMINQFNHLACWVTNMILLREKAKHRARALEKFMNIAWKLRYRNNYNSLGAIVAGINGNSIYRLVQTRELVTPKAQKEFMRLEILMGTQKGHFAYRLAWRNTSSPRIPFLPLHRRDLISGDEGNRTYLDEQQSRINWKKFDIMGDVIVTIQRSLANPYPELEQRSDVQHMILDHHVRDDDALYDRSTELETPGAGAGDTTMRRKFSWFQR